MSGGRALLLAGGGLMGVAGMTLLAAPAHVRRLLGRGRPVVAGGPDAYLYRVVGAMLLGAACFTIGFTLAYAFATA